MRLNGETYPCQPVCLSLSPLIMFNPSDMFTKLGTNIIQTEVA